MKIKAELYKEYIGTDSYICTVDNLHQKSERRKLVKTLNDGGFSCVLIKITHNKEYYVFHYIVRIK